MGDYVSIYSNDDESILSEIVKVNDSIYLINIFTLENISKPFNSLEELDYFMKNTKRQCDIYYIDNSKPNVLSKEDILSGEHKYLVYDDGMGYDYEVAITYDYEDKCFKIIDVGLNDLFYQDYFESFDDALATLNSECSLVKKLRI